MSELDYLELLSILRSEGASHGMGFFSVWSAFVIAAYLVGDKLSRPLALLLCGIYSFFLAGPLIFMTRVQDAITQTISLYSADFPNIEAELMQGTLELFFLSTYVVAWLLSIGFLWFRRNSHKLS